MRVHFRWNRLKPVSGWGLEIAASLPGETSLSSIEINDKLRHVLSKTGNGVFRIRLAHDLQIQFYLVFAIKAVYKRMVFVFFV